MPTRRVLQAVGDPSHEGEGRFTQPSHRINAEGEEGDLLLLTSGSERVLSPWDAVAGRIPILWTETAVKDGVKEGELADLWSWYGRWLRKELWGKLWMVRSRELAKLTNV